MTTSLDGLEVDLIYSNTAITLTEQRYNYNWRIFRDPTDKSAETRDDLDVLQHT